MPTNPRVLRVVRKVHLYSGVFLAPLILFLSFSGMLQTLNLHEATPDGKYQPAKWMLLVAQVHKNQTVELSKKAAVAGPPRGGMSDVMRYTHHLPLKIFFVVASLALIVSTLTGVYMGYKYARRKWVVTAWWVAGIVVPLVLLKI